MALRQVTEHESRYGCSVFCIRYGGIEYFGLAESNDIKSLLFQFDVLSAFAFILADDRK